MIAKQDNDFSDVTVQFLEVQALILVVIQLCQRNSGKMDEAGREVISSFFIQNRLISNFFSDLIMYR